MSSPAKNGAAFSLKAPPAPINREQFKPTSAAAMPMFGVGETVVNIGIGKLKHYSKHPFKLYTGERLNDMVESVKANGIIVPLIVRPLPSIIPGEPYEYEVLAGHNRLESGKLAELTEVPCIIKHGLTDEEAHLIVTETNLVQRSFSDLSHSERAEALATHYNAIKHQGKRTDLIRQVEALLNGDNTDYSASETNAPAGNKSIEVTGEKYGLSKNSVARYVRVNSLIAGFKDLLDSEELSIRAGVSLSYLDEQRQQTVFEQAERYEVIPSMKQAEQIRQLAADAPGDADNEEFSLGCADILTGRNDKPVKPKKHISFKLERSAIESYFKEDVAEEVIQETVLAALEFYHLHHAPQRDSDAE